MKGKDYHKQYQLKKVQNIYSDWNLNEGTLSDFTHVKI